MSRTLNISILNRISLNGSKNKNLTNAAFVVLILSFAVAFSGPIWDIDAWWHLATGKYMVEKRAFLSEDPFSFTSAQDQSYRTVVLNGYWLAQVIFYGAYTLLNNCGLITLRVLILLSILGTVFCIGKKMKACNAAIFVILVLVGFAGTYFTAERPQLFSFLLAPLLLYLLDDARNGYKKSDINIKSSLMLPGVMLLWANLHRGFIMGTALIILFLSVEIIELCYRRGSINESFLKLCLILLLAICASFVNPNTYKQYIEIFAFEGSVLQQRTSEYMSPIQLAIESRQFITPYWIYLLLCSMVFVANFRRVDKTHLAVVSFLAILSLFTFRYVPFFLYASAPYTAYYLSRIAIDKPKLKDVITKAVPLSLVVTVTFSLTGFHRTLGETLKHEIIENRFPEEAAEFIRAKSPSGKMFNHFDWGGYLIWKLYPQYKVFIDGRALSLKAFKDYTHILWDRAEAQSLLDSYGITIVIIPPYTPYSGERYELVNILLSDKQWHLVFIGKTSLVFLRGAENQGIINSTQISTL